MSRDRLLIVASISVGTALLACMISSIYAVLIDPLPFPQASQVVTVTTVQRGAHLSSSAPDYNDIASRSGPLSNSVYVRAYDSGTEINGRPAFAASVGFDGDLFAVFGRAPVLGAPRDLDSAQSPDRPAAILTYPAWARIFGQDPQVLGKAIRVGHDVYEVRAVLPPEYQLVLPADIWVPVPHQNAGRRGRRDGRIYARLASGVSVDRANAYLQSLSVALRQEVPDTNRGVSFEAVDLQASLTGKSELLLYLLALSAAIVLCVAYFNVYQLLAARAAAASVRWNICLALGANRKRIFQDIMKEPLLLTAAGCALGLLLSLLSMKALRALSPSEIPRIGGTRLVWQVVVISFAGSFLAALCFTVLMLRTLLSETAGSLHGKLRRGESIRHAFRAKRQSLLIAQMALSATLLITIGMVATALRKATSGSLGFDAVGVSVTGLELKEQTGTPGGREYVHQIMQNLRTLPGVESVASASVAPFEGRSYRTTFTVITDSGNERGKELEYVAVSPEFFHVLQTRVLQGRTFADTDNGASPSVAILNQSASQALFGAGESLYQRIKGNQNSTETVMQVVGVVEDIRQDPTTVIAPPVVYVPLSQTAIYSVSVLVRSKTLLAAATIKSRIWMLNANQAVHESVPLAGLIDDSLRRIRYLAFLMSLFAAVTVLLSGLGIYGAVAQWISTSRKEIALNLAMGATYTRIRNSVLLRIMFITATALALGVVLALGTSATLRSLLYGVQPRFSASLVFATLLMTVVAWLSSYMPALRSRFIDPAELLRSE